MKKIIAVLLLICTLILSACNNDTPNIPEVTDLPAESADGTGNVPEITESPETAEPPVVEDSFTPVLRFVAATDTHIRASNNAQADRVAKMIQQLTAYAESDADGYDKLDAIAVSGDITNDGTAEEFTAAKKVFEENIKEGTELVITTGNHDWRAFGNNSPAEFEKYFGEGCTMRDVVIGGYHFITIVGSSGQGLVFSKNDLAFAELMIQNAIADTGEDKPVFVFHHIGSVDTAAGTCRESDDKANTATEDLIVMESKYENLVAFFGHSHFPSYDECSVHQENFTSVNVGCMYYSMRSMVDNVWIEMPDKYNMCQCLLVEMDAESRMRIRCWDVLKGKFVGKDWLIESWNKEDFVYTVDRFTDDDIFFADGSKVDIEATFGDGAYISFMPVPAESLSGRVYEITVTDKSGKQVSQEYVGVEYFNEYYDTPIKHGIGGLEANTEYTVSVRAVNSLYTAEIRDPGTLYSKPISATFTMPAFAENSGADIIDVKIDVVSQAITNSAQNWLEAEVIGNAKIFHDETIGRDTIRFNGTTSGTVRFVNYSLAAATMKDSMSFEAYFKIDAVPEGRHFSIISAQQSAGFGIDAYSEGQMCKFHFHDGSAYRSLGFKYEVGRYYHLVAVYDGSVYTLYVDGEKIGSETLGVLLHFPSVAAQTVFMGADTDSNGNCSNPSKCTVASFKLYSYALTEAEVLEAYNNK